jgi:hypothetical protein
VIEFYDDGGVLGTVRVDGGELVADPVVEGYVKSWRRRGGTVGDFEKFYDGWSNGYVSARRKDDDDG